MSIIRIHCYFISKKDKINNKNLGKIPLYLWKTWGIPGGKSGPLWNTCGKPGENLWKTEIACGKPGENHDCLWKTCGKPRLACGKSPMTVFLLAMGY